MPLQPGNAFGDHGATRKHRGARVGAGGLQRCRYGLDVVPIQLHHMPACYPKTLGHVFADRQVGAAVVCDLVVVPQQHQFAQLQVAGQRDHFLPNPLLQTAIAHKGIGVVVHQGFAKSGVQISLGHRHAKSVGNALAQRAGGDLDAQRRVAFGVALAVRTQFAKTLNFFNRKTRIPGQV